MFEVSQRCRSITRVAVLLKTTETGQGDTLYDPCTTEVETGGSQVQEHKNWLQGKPGICEMLS